MKRINHLIQELASSAEAVSLRRILHGSQLTNPIVGGGR